MQEKHEMNREKKVNNKTILLLLLPLFVLAVFLILSFGIDRVSTEDMVFNSLRQALISDAYERECTLRFSGLEAKGAKDPETKLMLNVLKDMNIKIIHKNNKSTQETQLSVDILMRDVRIMEGKLYMNASIIGIEIPLLYQKPIYMTWGDFAKNYGISKEQIHVVINDLIEKTGREAYSEISLFEAQSYVDLIKLFLKETYEQAGKEKLEINEKNITVTKYQFKSDTNETIDFINQSVKTLLQDQKIKAIMNRSNQVFLFNENSIDQLSAQYPTEIAVSTDFFIDKKQDLKKISTTFEGQITNLLEFPVKGTLQMELSVLKTKDIIFEGLDMGKAVNISQLSEQEADALTTEMQDNLSKQLEKNMFYKLLKLK